MTPDSLREEATIADMIQACINVLDFVRDVEEDSFRTNLQLASAINFQVAILGEAAKRLSAATRERHPGIPWRDIAGMRDRLIHGYDDIDLAEVWAVAARDIPALLEQLREIQREFNV